MLNPFKWLRKRKIKKVQRSIWDRILLESVVKQEVKLLWQSVIEYERTVRTQCHWDYNQPPIKGVGQREKELVEEANDKLKERFIEITGFKPVYNKDELEWEMKKV